MPFKNFTPSELTSAEVNTYLMKQSVMVFDDASARASALTLPEEGMVTYLKDGNSVWIYDGTQWQNLSTPTGIVEPYAGVGAPAGWLLCAGQAISRTDYAPLFAVLGTTYGAGDGSTTFNIPDLRGRTVAGLDNMNGTDAGRLSWSNSLGTSGGSQTHELTASEINHRHDFTIGLVDYNYNATGSFAALGNAGAYRYSTSSYSGYTGNIGTLFTTVQPGTSPVNTTANRFYSTGDTNTPSMVGTSAHNNMQPTTLLNYIIKI